MGGQPAVVTVDALLDVQLAGRVARIDLQATENTPPSTAADDTRTMTQTLKGCRPEKTTVCTVKGERLTFGHNSERPIWRAISWPKLSDLPHWNPVFACFLGAVPHGLRWLAIYDRMSENAR
jgi:hypothetical protein